MKNKILWCVVGVLGATCVGQGYYIHAQHKNNGRSAVEDFSKEQDQWISQTRKSMFGRDSVPFERFDDLFNDDFFGRRFDPFAEIENFRKGFGPPLPNEERSLLDRSWRDWFEDRMVVADIHPEIKTTDEQVILSLKIPGLEGESLNINVNDDRIRIAYDVRTVQDKKDGQGASYFRSQSIRHFEKILPIPDGADPKRNRIVHEDGVKGNVVKIIFEKSGRA